LLLERPGPRQAHVGSIVLAPAKLPLFALPILFSLAPTYLEERTLIVIVVPVSIDISLPRVCERILLVNEALDSLLLYDGVVVPLTANDERRDVSLRQVGLDACLLCDLVSRLDLK
jgi:hypothetical protein